MPLSEIDATVDGQRLKIKADIPEGASPAQIETAVRGFMKSQSAAVPELKYTNPPKTPGDFGSRLLEMGKGAVKTIGRTAVNVAAAGLSTTMPTSEAATKVATAKASSYLQPSNKYQQQGGEATELAMYATPLGEEKLIALAPDGLRVLARIATDALSTGARATAITGSPETGSKAAVAGGVMSGLMAGVSKAAGQIGRKIQTSTIRPRAVDLADGFKWSTLDRLKLKGNLEGSLRQVDGELTRLRTERNALIAPGAANVDLGAAFDDAIKEVGENARALKYGHMGQDAIDGINAMKSDYETLLGEGKLDVDIRLAENAKEHVGTLGAWAYGGKDPKASIDEAVANTAYLKIKDRIEKSLGPQGAQVKALNNQMHELIPIKHAMLTRLPVEERNRMFSLADITAMLPAVATGNVGHLSLLGLTRAQKSLRFGNWLNRTPTAGAKASMATRMVAGPTSEADQPQP